MTHTEISQPARERLVEMNDMYLHDAVNSCLLEPVNTANIVDIVSEIFNLTSQHKKINYFAEATIAKHSDPVKRAKDRLKNGFKVGGVAIDISQAPNWPDFKSETRNIRYKLHSWVMLDTLLTADEKSDSDESILKAIDISHSWVKRYIISNQADEFAWYDMAVGQRATKLPYLLSRAIEMDLSPKLISHYILAIEVHITELSQADRIAFHSNHGLFQIAGLMAIVKSIPWLSLSKNGYQVALDYLLRMLNSHFTDDGLHKEHSPEYHLFMINHLSAFIESGWLDEIEGIKELTQKVNDAAHWMQTPSNEIIAMGDSKNNTPIKERWHLAADELNHGLKTFEKGGLIIHNAKKNGWSQVVYSCQFHSRQHKHADHQNFTFHSNGKPIIVDAGTYTYQYDLPERIYCESTRAHNTVEVDGNNYSRFRKDTFGSGVRFATMLGPCAVMAGEVHHKRLVSSFIPNNKISNTDAIDVDIKHRRTLVHFPSRFLAIIDEIQSPNEHEYIQWNHLSPELQLRKYTPMKFGIHDQKEKVVSRISAVGDENTNLQSISIQGQTQPHLQGWFSKSTAWDRELIENPALGFSSFGKSSHFATIIDTKLGITGDPYFRTGSNGSYKRFALTQDGNKADIKFRTMSDQKMIIEAVIDNEEYEVTLDINGG